MPNGAIERHRTARKRLAKKIADSLGREFKQLCIKAAKDKRLQPTDIVSIKTNTHGLIVNVVVHDLSSRVKFNDIAYKELLLRSYRNIFTQAKKYGICCLAMPVLGTYQKMFSNLWQARVICEALVDGIKSDEALREIHIVDRNRDFLMALWDELRKRVLRATSSDDEVQAKLTKISAHNLVDTRKEPTVTKVLTLSSNQTPPETRPLSTRSEGKPLSEVSTRRTQKSKHLSEELVSMPTYKVPCGYLLGNGIKVFIHRCDITKMEVDAIVNDANRNLQHEAGLAKAIADAAGPDLEEEGREIINNSGLIAVSQTVVTSAGNLPCTKVIHAVRPGWAHSDGEERQQHCFEVLRDTFTNILRTADKYGFSSLAIPAVLSSTGVSSKDDAAIIYEMVASVFGLPKYKVASITCEVLIDSQPDHLKEVHIVDTKTNVLQLIGGALHKMAQLKGSNKYREVIELSENIVSSTIEMCTEKHYGVMRPKTITVIFSSESLTTLKADAILCFNDEKLSSLVGLAKTVADTAGEQYQKQCKQTAQSKKLQTSDIVCIRTANLGIVIHAIVPSGITQYTKVAYKEKVYSALESAFIEIRKYGISRLIMSPTGVDQRQIPYMWMGEAICKGITELTKGDNHLKEIYFVDINDDYLRFLSHEMAKQVSYISVIDNVAKVGSEPISDQVPPKPKSEVLCRREVKILDTADKEQAAKEPCHTSISLGAKSDAVPREGAVSPGVETIPVSGYRVPCGFVIHNRIQVLIHKCDLRRLQVDAIVNFANANLDHSVGVAKAIIDAGGTRLAKECRKLIRRSGPVPVSQTVMTSAGNLPCKSVIHAVSPSWPVVGDDERKERCLEQLGNTFTNILEAAENQGISSLAIPAVISGVSGYAPDDVASFVCDILTEVFDVPQSEIARIICRALSSTRSGNLKQVHLVDISAHILPLIGGYFLHMTKHLQSDVTELDRNIVLSIIKQSTKVNLQEVLTQNKVKVFISCGDITKLAADAIVCSNDKKLSCSSGLAKRIARLAGKQYKLRCHQAAKDRKLRPSDIVSIETNALGLIINVVLPRATKLFKRMRKEEADVYKKVLYASFKNVINESKRCGISCLAISPLGADKKRIPHLWVADAMCRVIKDAVQLDGLLKEIHIVDTNNVLITLLIGRLNEQISSIPNSKSALHLQDNRMNDNEIVRSFEKPTSKLSHFEVMHSPTPTTPPEDRPTLNKTEDGNAEVEHPRQVASCKTAQPKAPAMATAVDSTGASSPLSQTGHAEEASLPRNIPQIEKVDENLLHVKRSTDTTEPEELGRAAGGSIPDTSIGSSPPTTERKEHQVKHFQKQPPPESVETKITARSAPSSVQESPQTPQIPRHKVPCGFIINNGLQVFIHKCDITRLETDAIVNLTNKNLDHPAGVTKAIFDAGGEQLEKERRDRLNRSGPLSVSQTVLTSGGLLPCKMVIHAVGPTWSFGDDDKKKKDCFKLLRNTFINILRAADQKTITSLAVPTVTSGTIGVPTHCVLTFIYEMLAVVFDVPNLELSRVICEVLASTECRDLKEVHLVDMSDQTLPLIGGCFTQMAKQTESNELHDIVELGADVVSSAIQKRVKRKQIEMTSRGKVKVFISCGDITKLKADAIVCSNDKKLSCSSGLAKDLAVLAGDRYKERCKEAAKERKLQPSDVVSINTDGLGLIINVVLPRVKTLPWTVKKPDPAVSKRFLRASIQNAIDEAKKCGVTRLALSPLGVGQKSIPNSWVADAMCKVLPTVVETDQQLKEIYIIDTNTDLVNMLRRKLKKHISFDDKTGSNKQPYSVENDKLTEREKSASKELSVETSSSEKVFIPQHTVPCGFLIGSKMQVLINKCDIKMLQVDAIVNFTNTNFDHHVGIGKAIFDAAGAEVESEVRDRITRSGPMTLPTTVLTSAGGLSCKKIIHAVGPSFVQDEDKKRHCLETLRETFIKVINAAEENSCKTLAVPAVVSGIFGVPKHDIADDASEMIANVFKVGKHEVARILCESLASAETKSVKVIYLVDKTDERLTLIGGYFLEMSRKKWRRDLQDVSELSHDVVSSKIEACLKRRRQELLIDNQLRIFVYCDDIMTVNTDAVVCANDGQLSCSSGLAKHIADSIGKSYKSRCRKAATSKKLKPSDAVPIKTDKHGVIINVIVPQFTQCPAGDTKSDGGTYTQSLRLSFQNAIHEAKMCGALSLALSPLGADQEGVSNYWIVDALCQSLKGCTESDHQLKEIHVVGTNKDLLMILKSELKKRLKRPSSIVAAVRQPVSMRKCSIPCGFLTMNMIEVFIHKCDITEIQVDAIVNHTNGNLDHATGVAKAIFRAAGPEMKKERRRILRRSGRLSECETVVTSAGRLPCKIVIHAVGPKWVPSDIDPKPIQCWRLLHNTFINVLDTADKQGVNTLAIPAVTSGVFGATSSKVMTLVYEALMNALKVPRRRFVTVICDVITDVRARNLKEVHLVDDTDQLLSLLGGAFLQRMFTKTRKQFLDVVRLDGVLVSKTIQRRLERKQKQTRVDDRVKVFVHCDEITMVKADAIVCPNDRKLSCASGPAKDIADSAGNDYKKRCKDAARLRTPKSSDVISIHTDKHGDIINVVMPRLRLFSKKNRLTNDESYKNLLRASFKNALKEARKFGSSSLVMYPLGAEEESISETWVADAMCETLSNCVEDAKQLKEIHIVHKDNKFLAFLWKKLHDANIEVEIKPKIRSSETTDKSLPRETSMVKKDASKLSVTELHDESVPLEQSDGIPCGFLTLNIIQVYIHKCDIRKLHVDALVNATDRKLDNASGMAKAISDAAGRELEHEGRRIINGAGPLRLCDTAVTSAGSLPCELVIHAVFPAWKLANSNAKKEQSWRQLQQTLANILRTADEYGINSLAMSAVISGNAAIPEHDVAPIIRDTLAPMYTVPEQEFAQTLCQVLIDTNPRTLREVHVVDTRGDVLRPIAEEFRQKNSQRQENGLLKVIQLGQDTVSSTISRRLQGRLQELVIDNRVKVFVSSEDILKLNVDAIVCPNDEMLSSSAGVARHIADVAGSQYERLCSEAASGKDLQPPDVVCVNADGLGIIINVVVPNLQTSFWTCTESDDYVYREILQTSFLRALDEARKCDVSSLAIYPLGADEDLVPSFWVVDKLCQALLSRSSGDEQIKEIYIVHKNKDLVKFLWRELKKRIYRFNVIHGS